MQPLMKSNIGRLCTIVRWNQEYQLAQVSNRYPTFQHTIRLHMIPLSGSGYRYAIATHNHFEIGKIKTNEKRCIILSYLKMTFREWFDKHPISDEVNQQIMAELPYRDSPNSNWRLVNGLKDILNYWDRDLIEKFRLDDFGIAIKGGGFGNIGKAKHALWASRFVVQLYIGINDWKGVIVVRGLYSIFIF